MAVDDSYTKVLLHMDGADASTTFTDESGKTWTANGNAQIDTAQSKFGGAAGLFDGTTDYITTPDHADFDWGNGDYTIDLWTRLSSINRTQALVNQTPQIEAYIQSNNTVRWIMNSGGAEKVAVSTGTLSANTWYHLAFIRYGNSIYIYINGTNDGSLSVTGLTFDSGTSVFAVGAKVDTTNSLAGWIDEFRASKGIARWTANFTPPTAPYGTSPSFGFGMFF